MNDIFVSLPVFVTTLNFYRLIETVKFCNQQIQFLLTDKSLTSLQKQEEIQKYRSLISKIKGKYDHYPGDLLDGQIQNG